MGGAVHPTALVADDTELGEGTVVGPYSLVGLDGTGSPVRLGDQATLRSHVVIYRGTVIGARFHAAHHVLIRETTEIGDDVSVGTGSIIEHHVVIGRGVRMHSRCFVPELSVLEDGAWLGPGVMLTNARYPNRPDTKEHLAGVHVGRDAVLGASVVVLPGVVIGQGAVIGAGAVVLEDVPAHVTMVGNPARSVR